MPAKLDKFLKRAALEYLTKGEKGVRQVALEKAVQELARHKIDEPESEGPITEPSAQSTGVSYSTPSEIVERRAQVIPREVVDGGDVRSSLDINDLSVPLLSEIKPQDPPRLTLPEPIVVDSGPGPEARVTTDVTNAAVPPLVGDVSNIGPNPQDCPPGRSPVDQQNPVPHSEGPSGGTTIDLPMVPDSGPFNGSSRSMPVAEIVPSYSTLATSTEVPAGSHPRRTWNSRVPSSDAVTSRETRTNPIPNQRAPSPVVSDPAREPPTVVKVTGYRILNTTVVLTLGIWKGVASYRDESILSNTLDILLGVVFAVILYWLGFLETSNPPCLIWLFHKDYAAPLRRSLKRRPSTSRRMSPGLLPHTLHDTY